MQERFGFRQVDGLPWAVVSVVDGRGRDTGYRAVRGPLGTVADHPRIAAHLEGRRVFGLTSRGPYPGHDRGHDALLHGRGLPDRGAVDPFVGAAGAWAHCFRHPERYLPPHRPAALISESDFKDPELVWRAGCPDGPPTKLWDLAYVCGAGRFREVTKGWSLARWVLQRLADTLGLRMLVVGRHRLDTVISDGSIEVRGELPWPDLMGCLARSRVVLFPNGVDPSPRLLAEVLCLDVPILVDAGILGGWKYVTPDTGAFFRTATEATENVVGLLTRPLQPRAWFADQYGPWHASDRLSRLILAELGPDSPS